MGSYLTVGKANKNFYRCFDVTLFGKKNYALSLCLKPVWMNGWKGVFDLGLCNENVEKTSQSDDKHVENTRVPLKKKDNVWKNLADVNVQSCLLFSFVCFFEKIKR